MSSQSFDYLEQHPKLPSALVVNRMENRHASSFLVPFHRRELIPLKCLIFDLPRPMDFCMLILRASLASLTVGLLRGLLPDLACLSPLASYWTQGVSYHDLTSIQPGRLCSDFDGIRRGRGGGWCRA